MPVRPQHRSSQSLRHFIACLSLLTVAGTASAAAGDAAFYPERRKEQFTKDFGYAVFPYPYSLPGIGKGLSVVGGALNVADSPTDLYAIAFGGDVRGMAGGIGDIHLIPKTLIAEVGYSTLNKASIQSYAQRGMSSGKDDYRLLEIGDAEFYGGRLTATFADRRFEIYGSWYTGASRLNAIRDKDGGLIVETRDAPRTRGDATALGMRIDFTDDYADPRRGIRADVARSFSPPSGSGADYHVLDYTATAYVPLGKRSTWAFNVMRSDAIVERAGQTDAAALQAENGLDCAAISDTRQRSFCDEVIANIVAANRYGTATQLGGFNRLRSYPQGRFKGAHTAFFGTEIRWNLNEDHTPFDIFVMKDVRTLIQAAFFFETGVSSDDRHDLRDRALWRNTYGAGLRVVTASGVVFRADVGHSRDGFGTAMFIGYPWEL